MGTAGDCTVKSRVSLIGEPFLVGQQPVQGFDAGTSFLQGANPHKSGAN